MPPTSRKRKTPHSEADEEAARAIFQRHFEAQFAPLPEPVRAATDDRSEDEEDDDSEGGGEDEDEEWGGISDEDEQAVEVVDHTSKEASGSTMGRREQKDFMSSRPPTEDRLLKKLTSAPASSHPEDSRTLLSQDLELHRLITESHLLDPSSKLHTKSFAEGRIRAKTADLRLTRLAPGAASIHAQKSMPMGMRRGIEGAKKEREERRRREAWENGIVLERKAGGGPGPKRRRGAAGVGMPGIGRMRGAELSLSERDIQSMESGGGSRGSSRGRGGRGGRARGNRR